MSRMQTLPKESKSGKQYQKSKFMRKRSVCGDSSQKVSLSLWIKQYDPGSSHQKSLMNSQFTSSRRIESSTLARFSIAFRTLFRGFQSAVSDAFKTAMKSYIDRVF